MKPGESFQLSESWWKAGKPVILTDTGLSKALRDFKSAEDKFNSKKEMPLYIALSKALTAVNAARVATIAKCGSNPLLKTTKDALAKDAAIAQKKAALKATMTPIVEAEVKKIEAKLVEETKDAQKFANAAKSFAQKIAAAEKANDAKALKEAMRNAVVQSRDANETMLAVVSEDARVALGSLSGVVQDFAGLADRLKAVIAKSKQNVAFFQVMIKFGQQYDNG